MAEQGEEPKGESEEGESGESAKKHSPDAVHYKYVIVGSGTAGYAALKVILIRDADAKVCARVVYSMSNGID